MNKSSLLVLPTLLLMACGESTERYRDTHHLELPPELPIEHTHRQAAVGSDDMKPKAASSASVLSGLMAFEEVNGKPILTLKTRPERAWEMVSTALRITGMQVTDKNREQRVFQVKYDADVDGKDVGLFSLIFNADYPEADYAISLKDEGGGMRVNVTPNQGTPLDESEDGSDELVRLLHKTIDEKIINRAEVPPKDD